MGLSTPPFRAIGRAAAFLLPLPALILLLVAIPFDAVGAQRASGGHTMAAVAQDGEDDGIDVSYDEDEGGTRRNVVSVRNRADNRMRIRANIQLARLPGDTAEPYNVAFAYGTCRDCQTFSVALQIVLISRTASRIAPQNGALALNYECHGCLTVARAIQYVVQVEDPTQVPDGVRELIREMDRELREVARLAAAGQMTIADAESRINAVITRFRSVATSLYEQRSEEMMPTTP